MIFPKDVQTKIIEIEDFPSFAESMHKKGKAELKVSALKNIADVINKAKKPIIFAGGGITSSKSNDDLYNFAKKSNIPVTLSLMGIGAFPHDDELSLGMLGMHGAPYTNYLINEADLIIALGVRFDDRATGNVNDFCPNAKIIHVDIDASEINKIKSIPKRTETTC